jgi:hypothetical protein
MTIFLVACGALSKSPGGEEPRDPSSDFQHKATKLATSQPYEGTPIEPLLGPGEFIRDPVFMEPESSQILLLETYPVQVMLELEGSLPTPCHRLQVDVAEPDNENRIYVEVYSLTDPSMECIQVLKDFTESVLLGKFTTGSYTVWLNGENVGDFSLP